MRKPADRTLQSYRPGPLALHPSIVVAILCALWTLASAPLAEAAPNRWQSQGPSGADVRGLAIDPFLPTTLYAGTTSGTIFKTVDQGTSWQEVLDGEGSTRTLVVDPQVPSNVYAGTSESMWKSSDSGDTWQSLGEDLPNIRLASLVIDPQTTTTLYAVYGGDGIFKSVDGGASWNPANTGLGDLVVHTLAIDPSAPATLYSSTSLGGVWKSTNGGDSWAATNPEAPLTGVTALAVDPSSSDTVYAGTTISGISKSLDGGVTWAPVVDLPSSITQLLIDAAAPEVVYASTLSRGVWRSSDGGLTWNPVGTDHPETQISALTIDPAGLGTLYTGTPRGVFENVGGEGAWQPANQGLNQPRVDVLAIDPMDPRRLFVVSRTSRFVRSDDSGATWEPANEGLGPAILTALAIDPTAPHTLYLGGADGKLLKTTDGADTWQATGLFLARPILDVAVDPIRPGIVFAASDRGGVMRTTDGGATWTHVLDLFPATDRVVIAPTLSDRVFALNSGQIWHSEDGGAIWSRSEDGLDGNPVRSLTVDPTNADMVYVGGGGGKTFKSMDGGATWAPAGTLPSALLVQSLVVDPAQPSTLYAATEGEVFRSIDGAATWSRLPRGLETSEISALQLDPQDSSRLYAVTRTGVFVIDLVTRLQLQQERFDVEIRWQDFQGTRGPGSIAGVADRQGEDVALRSDDSAVFEFFGEDNWVLLIKVLDGRDLTDHFWVFAAAATDVAYDITVTDTACGDVWDFSNPIGQASPAVTDTEALPGCAEPAQPSCVASEETVCLGEGRFAVEVAWRDFGGEPGVGREVKIADGGLATSNDSGLFYFFDEENWEMLIKVLDGCSFNGHYWIFAAATTDVAYDLQITDTVGGQTLDLSNRLGNASPAITLTDAFDSCP